MRALQCRAELARKSLQGAVEAFPIKSRFINGIEKEPSWSDAGAPTFEALDRAEVKCRTKSLIRKFFYADVECCPALGIELRRLIPELL